MLNERIVRYGTGNIGVTVNGIRVLLTVSGDEQSQVAEALAVAIASIGPEGGVEQPIIRTVTPAVVEPTPRRKKAFTVGQRVWCTVHAIAGWKTVTAVNADGRIKIDGGRVWCPLHNFEECQPEWQAR